ncbi:hypothetical protein FRC14_001114 [Serendipita sp. 396]|nr:hypothetical protein FRC14_001114 [Serendipita sp. 396]
MSFVHLFEAPSSPPPHSSSRLPLETHSGDRLLRNRNATQSFLCISLQVSHRYGDPFFLVLCRMDQLVPSNKPMLLVDLTIVVTYESVPVPRIISPPEIVRQ